MMETETRERYIQAFLSNQAFLRSFEVFDTYQQLLAKHAGDATRLEKIRERMKLVFNRKETGDDEQRALQAQAINAIFDSVFALLEKGELTKKRFAEICSGSLIAEQLLETWNSRPGAGRENGKVMVNEVLEYFVADEGKSDMVDINILPPNIRGEEVWKKVFEGLKLLAQEIDHGTLQHIQTVRAQSWLFSSPFFREKLKPFLGDDATFEDMPEDDGDTAQVQKIALTYHKGTLKEFLLNGTLPQVQRLEMGRKEFLEKFL